MFSGSFGKIFILLFALTLGLSATARNVYVYGTIRDDTHEPVAFATVNEEKLLVSAVSSFDGSYSLKTSYADTITLVFRMIGHETRKRQLIEPQDTVFLDVVLPVEGYSTGEVTISERYRQMDGTQVLKAEDLHLAPSASGNAIESFIATQAGVNNQNELSSQYSVRGGNFDENSVYVNGVEIFRPMLVRSGQQEGLSFLNPAMVQDIYFSSGGFQAKYSDKMSSVLDVTYKRPERTEGSVSVDLMGSSIYFGTGNKKISFINSLRYKTNRYLLGSLDTEGEYNPNFLDYQAYFTWNISKKLRFNVLGNIARNNYRFTPATRSTSFGTLEDTHNFKVYFDGWERDLFQTLFASVGIDYKLSDYSNIGVGFSAFSSYEVETYDIAGEYWLDNLDRDQNFSIGRYMEHARNLLKWNTQQLKVDGTHYIGNNILKWGVEGRREHIMEQMREWENRDSAGYTVPKHDTGALEMVYSIHSQSDITNWRWAAYVQNAYHLNTNRGLFTFNLGARLSGWSWNNELLFSPRFSVGYVPQNHDNLTFRFSAGLYYQSPFYKELKDTVVENGIGKVVLNKNIKSQKSIQFVLGGDWVFNVFNRSFKLSSELYYKILRDLIPYNVDNVRIVYYGNNCADGYAVGWDTKLFGEFVPGVDSWISFSLMRTHETIAGKDLPRPQDQLYNLSLYFTDFFPNLDRLTMNLKLMYSGGLPFGPPHTGREEMVFRAPDYMRIDMGLSYNVIDNKKNPYYNGHERLVKNFWIGLDCFNIIGANNVNSYYWVNDINGIQFAVPNYLTGRRLNLRLMIDF